MHPCRISAWHRAKASRQPVHWNLHSCFCPQSGGLLDMFAQEGVYCSRFGKAGNDREISKWNTVIQMTILNKYIKEGCNNSICIVSNLSSHFNAYFWSARLSQLLCLMLQTVKLWEAAFLQNASHCIPYMFSFSSPSEVYSFQSLPASSGGESRNG